MTCAFDNISFCVDVIYPSMAKVLGLQKDHPDGSLGPVDL